MRRYGMYDASRGLTLAFAAALAGLGLWGAAQIGTQTPGRFWVAMAVVAGAGLLLTLANHVGTWTKGLRLRLSVGTFVLAFLPVLVCVGWILIATQPGSSGWQEGRIDSWSNSIGILGVVHSIGLWHGVWLTFSLDFERNFLRHFIALRDRFLQLFPRRPWRARVALWRC